MMTTVKLQKRTTRDFKQHRRVTREQENNHKFLFFRDIFLLRCSWTNRKFMISYKYKRQDEEGENLLVYLKQNREKKFLFWNRILMLIFGRKKLVMDETLVQNNHFSKPNRCYANCRNEITKSFMTVVFEMLD
jgi:hypothetical protein